MELMYLLAVLIGMFILYIWARYERRSLIYGAAVLLWLGMLYGGLFIVLLSFSTYNLPIPFFVFAGLGIILVAPIFIAIFSPLIVIGTLLFNGVMVIRKEGFSLSHSLALGCGVGAIIYFFVTGWSVSYDNALAYIMTSYVGYFAFIFFMYLCTTLVNLVNLPHHQLDYIIVLGAGLIGDQVTPLLASRINKAIQLQRKQKTNCKLIMTGGQGEDEWISEAEAMTRYAIEQGISPTEIIQENKAINTEENVRFSYELMTKEQPQVAIVTNYYHVFRSLIIAKQQGYKCIGYGAKTKFYYTVNAYIREFIGYLSITRKQHFIVCGILTFVLVAGLLMS